jgi:hypothetical protein
MGLVAKETGDGKGYDPIPEGLHEAVCYRFFDLGTQFNETFGKSARKVLLMWEIPGERIEIERDGQTLDLPRAISKQYTLSLHKKSNLRHDLESWRGRRFTADELQGFDLCNILGASCQLQVMNETKNDRTYANIANILPNKAKLIPENKSDYFSFEEHDKLPENTPEWIATIIAKSDEWKAMKGDPKPGDPERTVNLNDDDDDIPF